MLTDRPTGGLLSTWTFGFGYFADICLSVCHNYTAMRSRHNHLFYSTVNTSYPSVIK